jgi:hypothetical protein
MHDGGYVLLGRIRVTETPSCESTSRHLSTLSPAVTGRYHVFSPPLTSYSHVSTSGTLGSGQLRRSSRIRHFGDRPACSDDADGFKFAPNAPLYRENHAPGTLRYAPGTLRYGIRHFGVHFPALWGPVPGTLRYGIRHFGVRI